MTGFERHGIRHLSASSLNLWAALPGLWALRYLCGFRDQAGPAATCGNAVEDALKAILHGRGDPLAAALQTFDNNMQGEISDAISAERAIIPGMVEQCKLWQPPGPVMASQMKVEFWIDGIAIPIIGYVDFCFEDTDVDLKTTKACPSKPKADHVRQVAMYRTARKKRGKLLYVTEKKHAEFEVTDEMRDAALAEISHTAQALELLSVRLRVGARRAALPADRPRQLPLVGRRRARAQAGAQERASATDMRFLADAGLAMGFEPEEIEER